MTRAHPVAEVEVEPDGWTVYVEGWQSWSPATAYTAGQQPLLPAEGWQHTMRFRPGTEVSGTAYQAEGLAVLDPGGGRPSQVVLAADLGDPTTLHVTDHGDRLTVDATGPTTTWEAPDVATGLVAAGERIAAALGARTGQNPRGGAPGTATSKAVTAADVRQALADSDGYGVPVDVVQIDDGWSTGLGDGLRPRGDFADGGLERLVGDIRESGRRAGVWLAPFLVGAQTEVAREHPEWLTGDAGFNWGQQLLGLDLLHPGVQELLRGHLAQLRDLGVDYLKLDFLYPGAMPFAGRDRAEGVRAYRTGLELVRDVMGEDCLMVGCGARSPSVGLVDAMRVCRHLPRGRGRRIARAAGAHVDVAARAWMHGRLWSNDPDCVIGRDRFRLREEWARAALTYGGLRSYSDRWDELDEAGQHLVREVMAAPVPDRFGADVVASGVERSARELQARQDRGDLG